ncbi:hypothetical protein [Microbacterium arabinogalactanolyticum]|uniref:hypothetical protein n=1 Tax=Microbacterium arabinogalactanolyticum TaxID=69365 RepID=UPI0025568E63|nr:hypothetical protein [Microbacterium arabinogalactanolyticum]
MRLRPLLLIGSLSTIIALSACTAHDGPVAQPLQASPTTSSVEVGNVPAPNSTPRVIEISLDGMSIDAGEEIPYSDRSGVLEALSGVLGPLDDATPRPDSYGLVVYEWGSVKASMFEEGDVGIWIASREQNEVEFQGPEGVMVGWTREQALAAGAEDIAYDADGDGKADQLAIGAREVAGTVSLTDPGRTGREYIVLDMEGDKVTHIISNGNDFSDL